MQNKRNIQPYNTGSTVYFIDSDDESIPATPNKDLTKEIFDAYDKDISTFRRDKWLTPFNRLDETSRRLTFDSPVPKTPEKVNKRKRERIERMSMSLPKFSKFTDIATFRQKRNFGSVNEVGEDEIKYDLRKIFERIRFGEGIDPDIPIVIVDNGDGSISCVHPRDDSGVNIFISKRK